jgi:PAS domain S-box-containing protein
MTTPNRSGSEAARPSEAAALDILRQAFEKAPQGVIGLKVNGTILFANQSADRIFACGRGELVGQSVGQFFSFANGNSDTGLWNEHLLERQGGSVTKTDGVVGRRKDGGTVPLEVCVETVALEDFRCLIASITERLSPENMMLAARDGLDFQHLIADIAARLAGVNASAVDGAIVTSLAELVETLKLDVAMLSGYGEDETWGAPTHYWVAPGCLTPPAPHVAASMPWMLAKLEAGEACWFRTVEDVPDPADRQTCRLQGVRSTAVFPLARNEHESLQALSFSSMTRELEWTPPIVERLRLLSSIISQALARKTSQAALDETLEELRRLRDRAVSSERESVEARGNVKVPKTRHPIVSESAAARRALVQVEQVAPTPATVLLVGETGTGKEVFAQVIHDLSSRRQRPMVRVSCAAIPSALIESELFGRERGAFTGALSRQIGRFEAANQSTLFLDEIGELQPEVQVKLLRVLQDRVIERLGSVHPIKVDVRIIAATNRDLEKAVAENTFREDLYYRLNVFPVVVPPLRERLEDLPGLVWAFIDEFSRLFGKTISSVSKDSMRELQRYAWPGNVRELRNVIERAVILSTDRHLVIPAPKPIGRAVPQAAMTLEAFEVEHIRAVLESTSWRVRGEGGAAQRLGLKPTTLESRMARLGITRKRAS